jgi:hypothetical protein
MEDIIIDTVHDEPDFSDWKSAPNAFYFHVEDGEPCVCNSCLAAVAAYGYRAMRIEIRG